MKKHILTWDFLLTAIGCFFGGLLDGFSFLYRDQSFTTVQTGNLVKIFISFIYNDFLYSAYLIIIFISFCIFVLLFHMLCRWLKYKKINYHYVLMPLIIILLIPSAIWKFNNNDSLDVLNIISGVGLSAIGAIIAVSFRHVQLKFDDKIIINLTFMTGNIRSMMFSLSEFFETKNKEKLYVFFIYLSMLGFFALGAASTALFYFKHFAVWQQQYPIVIFMDGLCLLMMWISHIRYKKYKDMIKIDQS
ncbi:MAG: DUF1275 domain-containing protein [Mycoplasma sp.]|nr:DUF1275 domain-containing protein [Mycoplasma sp.]